MQSYKFLKKLYVVTEASMLSDQWGLQLMLLTALINIIHYNNLLLHKYNRDNVYLLFTLFPKEEFKVMCVKILTMKYKRTFKIWIN